MVGKSYNVKVNGIFPRVNWLVSKINSYVKHDDSVVALSREERKENEAVYSFLDPERGSIGKVNVRKGNDESNYDSAIIELVGTESDRDTIRSKLLNVVAGLELS